MKITLSLLTLLLASPILAQPVITAAELLPPLGPCPVQDHGYFLPPGPATADFVFDASGFVTVQPTQLQYLPPANTPFSSDYPLATHAYTDLDFPNVYVYFQETASEVLCWGLRSIGAYFINSDPQKFHELPMTFNQTFTDAWAADAQSYQGVVFTRTGTTTVSYNGYGTVILPSGTYTNCARIENNEVYTDTNSVNGNGNYMRTVVTYYKPGLSSPVFSSEVTLAEFTAGYDTLEAKGFALNDAAMGIQPLAGMGILARVYPNPVKDHAILQLMDTPCSSLVATLLDATGRSVRVLGEGNNFREQQLAIDVSDLQAGIYFVRLSDADGRTGSLPLLVE